MARVFDPILPTPVAALWPSFVIGCSGPGTPGAAPGPPQDAQADMVSDAAIDSATREPSDADSSAATRDSSGAASCEAFDRDGGICNTLPLTGPVVTDTCSSSEPPQPQGGQIDDGVYVLQATTWYGACRPTTTQTTWNICGGRWDVAQSDGSDASVTTLRIGFAANVGPTSVTLTPACQSGAIEPVLTRSYSAYPGHLTFITEYSFQQKPAILVGEYVKR